MRPIIAIYFALFYITSQAQTNTPVGQQVTPATPAMEAPAVVTSRFGAEYPNATVIWHQQGENFIAEYTDDASKLKKQLIYDKFGNQLGATQQLKKKKYPGKIDQYFEKHHPEEEYLVWERSQNSGNYLYYSVFKNDTLMFDRQGNVVLKAQTK
jgi:hypothetical protein